jgi:hypothetical protein
MAPTAALDTGKEKNLCVCRKSNLDSSGLEPTRKNVDMLKSDRNPFLLSKKNYCNPKNKQIICLVLMKI